jgi:hypothetical protein
LGVILLLEHRYFAQFFVAQRSKGSYTSAAVQIFMAETKKVLAKAQPAKLENVSPSDFV